MISEELQAGIDSMRELIDNASGTDIASMSVRFIRELFDAMDALQSKLDAVPVAQIRIFADGAIFTDPDSYTSAVREEIETWLEQVQP